ncbi:hypothetical protein IGI04_000875 [Brassica rapa subsp. trilocularis]|uniref:Uncharacterized protein n=1 Tax=Brassica rapa subsp. trilocularis TaxID=1813537 RepID=A0ABQ7NRB3_BRACM|nr:hypothetical protein IGI04_000875 [Brassica rapa subsp. trilocularis]
MSNRTHSNITKTQKTNKQVTLYKTTLGLKSKTKPVKEGTDSLSTACTNVQHLETCVKARVSHLPPALQRRGDRLLPSAKPKPIKKDAQTESSSRLIKSLPDQRRKRQMRPRKENQLGRRRTKMPVKRNRDSSDEKPPSTLKRHDAESKTGDTKLKKTPHPRIKS